MKLCKKKKKPDSSLVNSSSNSWPCYWRFLDSDKVFIVNNITNLSQ